MEAPTPTMRGRVAVVTGGTSGVGLEIVRGLALRGAHAVIVGRGAGRVSQVVEELRRTTGNPEVEGVPVDDLALRSRWPVVAAQLLRRLPAIHVLVNNAGAVYFHREMTSEGDERTFALNVLAPLALISLLQDRLRASAPARIVNIASAAHFGHSLDLSDLQSANHYRGFDAYGRSKLELMLLTRELALRFAGSGVVVNCVHPGFIRSGFGRNNRGAGAAAVRIASIMFGKSPRTGAKTPLKVAGDFAYGSVSGEYFSGGRIVTGSNASRDLSGARRLYEACLPLTGAPDIPLPPDLIRRAS